MKIYIWRDKKLAKDLHDGIVTEKEQMIYLLITTVFASLFATATVGHTLWGMNSVSLSIYDYASDFCYIALILATIIISYKINAQGNNQDFTPRYVCLTLPIAVKLTVLAIILVIPSFFIDLIIQSASDMAKPHISGEELEQSLDENIDSMQTGIATFTSLLLVSLFSFWKYTSSFKIASGQTEYNK